MNIPLLLKVKAAILAEPAKFDMDQYFQESKDSPCGTTACIAGWAVAINGEFNSLKDGIDFQEIDSVSTTAREELGITYYQSINLFHVRDWPSEFANRYRRCKTARGRAKVAADRIDRFIETEGKV